MKEVVLVNCPLNNEKAVETVERYLTRYGIADARWIARQVVEDLKRLPAA